MSILDSWYFKWTNLFKSLIDSGAWVREDLTGGMDSRMALTLMVASGAKLDDIHFNTYTDTMHTHAEDLEIAKSIGEEFGFPINKIPVFPNHEISLKDDIDKSFYTKLGLHREMYFASFVYEKPLFHITGSGGELIREYQHSSLEKMIEEATLRQGFLDCDYDFIPGMREVLLRSQTDMENLHDKKYEGKEFGRMLFREGNNRSHFGKAMLELFLSNEITLAPLEDSSLQALNPNTDQKDLIAALIYKRYAPKLLEFPFDSGRSFPEDTLKKAEELCELFPLNDSLDGKFGEFNIIIDENRELIETGKESEDPEEWCRQMMKAPFIKKMFCNLYPEKVYEKLCLKTNEERWMSIASGYVILAAAIYSYDSIYSVNGETGDVFDFFEKAKEIREFDDRTTAFSLEEARSDIEKCLELLTTAQIDFKVINESVPSSDLRILSSNLEDFRITTPKWFNKNGVGYAAHCDGEKSAKIEFECANDGTLLVRAKGPWTKKGKKGNHLPIYVDFDSLKINKRKLIKERTPLSCDDYFEYSQRVKAGQKITIEANWEMHDWKPKQLQKIFNKMLKRRMS